MAEMADDLSTPLGQQTVRRKRRFRLPFTGIQALAVLLGLFLLAFAGFAIFGDNPLGGEPVARIAIRQPAPAADQAEKSARPIPLLPSTPGPQPGKARPPSTRPSPSSTAPAASARTW